MTLRSTFVFALAAVLVATAVSAQDPAAPPVVSSDATFEVGAIKPSNPDPSNPLSMVPLAIPRPGGRFTATNMPLNMIPLVKNLLIERFKLKVHTEPREMQVYE